MPGTGGTQQDSTDIWNASTTINCVVFLPTQDPVSICMVLRRLLKATQTYLERGARHPLRSNALV